MMIGHDIHSPLAGHLAACVPVRPFHDQPRLAWITADYLNPASLAHLRRIAPAYGVKTLVFDDHYFRWETELGRNPAVDNWLAAQAGQTPGLGILVATADERRRLEETVLHAWQVPIAVFSREEHIVLDATGARFGGGRLPCLRIDQLIPQASATDLLVRIDHPRFPAEAHAAWANVFAVSLHLLTGTSDPAQLEEEYFRLCFNAFAPEIRQAFTFARSAVEKSLWTQGIVQMMPDGCWPDSLDPLDRQVAGHAELDRPTKTILAKIDFEKIEGLEAAHDAWKVLDTARPRIDPKIYVWLEHYFQHLKIVCLVLRSVADVYFSRRAAVGGSAKIAAHILTSKLKELVNHIEAYTPALMAFDPRTVAAGARPLSGLVTQLAKF